MAPLTHTTHNQKFAQQEEEVGDFVQDGHPVGRVSVDSEPRRGGRVSTRLVGRWGWGRREAGRGMERVPNLIMFLISRKKAFLAEVQKLVP